ncbi:TOPRIM nucleotidyl transferase/hydrolase domain-containing protein [Clostridium sp. ZBS12]|uniref:TOPRIM nucleotidyl transferase/hydrolase domain-containing protein n=1 Tax=Clostridium sp. ZBS12 TaxID=2949972 RepID=UPI00207AE1CD|nr:TOPRIM nucleotidyl transferase/hydrolase domain-containing protein [Clostridium sp. ZBS12]
MFKSPYISRVEIKNFRNFKSMDINLNHKQVIIGENSVGKTNYIYALQLILDPTLSDQDRMLKESDFYEEIKEPFKNREEIYISIEIDNYEHNKSILSQINGAKVKDDNGNLKLKITYKFIPVGKNNKYEYIIFKGNDEKKLFTYKDREILNIKVIGALRDVEKELKNTSKSPINKMLKEYDINFDEIQDVVDRMHKASEELLNVDEIIDITEKINKTYLSIMGKSDKSNLQLNTMELKAEKLLYSMKLLKGSRGTNDNSLGINNILYISLILSQLEDTTIPTLLKKEEMDQLKEEENSEILDLVYDESNNGNYFLKKVINEETYKKLYNFMSSYKNTADSFTILAIEEPEAHLHPINQRLVFKEVIQNSNSSVILTTHSTHITAITPLDYILALRKFKNSYTKANSAYKINLNESEKSDIQRYIDIKKSEIYFGKGVIFVEGIAEEYLIPRFAELCGYPLEQYGIVVCNINSTNFKPFMSLCEKLSIPFTVITDGDFYYENIVMKKNKKTQKEEPKIEREYHILYSDDDERKFGYLGNEVIGKQLVALKEIDSSVLELEWDKQDIEFNKLGIFISEYTLEVEIMISIEGKKEASDILKEVYGVLVNESDTRKKRFNEALDDGDYFECLNRIEAKDIGKGRFAQRLSLECNEDYVPQYIEESIEYITHKVEES